MFVHNGSVQRQVTSVVRDMFRLIRARKKTIFLLFATIIVIFLTSQLFSLKILSRSTTIKELSDEKSNLDLGKIEKKMDPDKNVPKNRPRGVHEKDAEYYISSSDGNFQCLETKEVIPYQYLNDDFCDCRDSSDEPGTSACHNSRFYCTFQWPGRDPQFVPSSRVNDGICDCCDGSDEWEGRLVPPEIHIDDKSKRYSVFQAPCEHRCARIIRQLDEEQQIRQLGKKVKKEYIDSGKGHDDMYGAFYKLSMVCFPYQTSEYQYTVCPFKTIKQQHFPHPSVVLGKKPAWKSMSKDSYILKMTDGDRNLCPSMEARSTLIYFLCGLNDKVIKVTEDEKCSYIIKFSTPAAC